MSVVQVLSESCKDYGNTGRYYIAELASGAHKACVAVSSREFRVVVENASNRAWRGMGRGFADANQAIDYYRTPAIRAMVLEAARRSERAQAVPA